MFDYCDIKIIVVGDDAMVFYVGKRRGLNGWKM